MLVREKCECRVIVRMFKLYHSQRITILLHKYGSNMLITLRLLNPFTLYAVLLYNLLKLERLIELTLAVGLVAQFDCNKGSLSFISIGF